MNHHSVLLVACLALSPVAGTGPSGALIAAAEPAVEAVNFTSQEVYRSERPPGYAAWVSFFPGEKGQWYIGCEEVSRPSPPLPEKELEFWYVERYQPGYDSWNTTPLAKRMKAGGTALKPVTDSGGRARVELPSRFNDITNPHLSYQLVVRFNMDRGDPDYKPYQTPQLEFYAYASMPEKLTAEQDEEPQP